MYAPCHKKCSLFLLFQRQTTDSFCSREHTCCFFIGWSGIVYVHQQCQVCSIIFCSKWCNICIQKYLCKIMCHILTLFVMFVEVQFTLPITFHAYFLIQLKFIQQKFLCHTKIILCKNAKIMTYGNNIKCMISPKVLKNA
jgi:hypothetical protein